MTRAAVFSIVAVLALVLVYPATTPSARAPVAQDTPIQIINPGVDEDTSAYTGDGDQGDADDLAGVKERKSKPVGASVSSDLMIQVKWAFKVWRMYIFGFGPY